MRFRQFLGQQQQQQTKPGQKLANASALRWTWKAGRLEIGTEKRLWRHYHQGWIAVQYFSSSWATEPWTSQATRDGIGCLLCFGVGWVREEIIYVAEWDGSI